MTLTAAESSEFHAQGFTVRRSFAAPDLLERMRDDVVGVCRGAAGAGRHEDCLVLPESNLARGESPGAATTGPGPGPDRAEQRVSKVFRLHRRPAFRAFIEDPDVLAIVASLLGPRLDCFLSQFIFKNPGAWGQPWHQDAFYFPFDRGPQVGLWLAITEATLDNGCLHVVPGSHREPVHDHVPDCRPGANFGYMEIVDQDTSSAVPVTMAPGDLLVFHSHLMHASTDNHSGDLRAAMVFHCAQSGTRVRVEPDAPVNDWMPLPAAPAA